MFHLGICVSACTRVCSYTCGLLQQEDTLPELIAQNHAVSYRIMEHTREIKRLELKRQPQQVH